MKCLLISLLTTFFWCHLQAQSEQQLLQNGSRAYEAEDYVFAIQQFKESLALNPNTFKNYYNLGNAFYKQKEYASAAINYQKALELSSTNSDKAAIEYNWGNALLVDSRQKLEEQPNKEEKAALVQNLTKAIDHYKQALRFQPQDFEAKINLAMAFKLWRKHSPLSSPPKESKQAQDKTNTNASSAEKPQKDNKDKDWKKLMQMIDQEDKKMQQKRNRSNKKNSTAGKKDW